MSINQTGASGGKSIVAMPSGEWLSPWRFAAILGGLIVLSFPQVVTGFHSFVFRDFGLFGYPIAHYHRECFWRGEMPLWNPYSDCGIPFLAQWNTMVLYPPSLIYLLLPLPWSLGIFMLLHQFFGGMGMYMLASRWTDNRLAGGLGGIAFAFNGFTLNCLMWPSLLASLAWMPWVLLAVANAWRDGGRKILIASLIGALQMLSGTPEVILCTWLIAAVLWFGDRLVTWRQAWIAGARVGLVIVLVAALSAAQLLPFFELLSHSQRHQGYERGQWPLPGWGWGNLFVPLFHTFATGAGVHFQSGQLLTSSYYPGLTIILLSALGMCCVRDRRPWLLGLLIIGSVLVGMGDNGPVYAWLRTVFPQVGFMRYTSKFVIVLAICFPLLGAFGCTALQNQQGLLASGKVRLRLLLGMVALIIGIVDGIILCARVSPLLQENWMLTAQNGCVRVLFLLLATAILCAVSRGLRRRSWMVSALLLIVVGFDLMKHAPQQNPTIPQDALTVKIPSLEELKPRPVLGQSRILLSLTAQEGFSSMVTSNLTSAYLLLRAGLYANANLLERVPKVDGFFALNFDRQRDVYHRTFDPENVAKAGLARFLGVSHETSSTNFIVWTRRANPMPLVTTGQVPEFATPGATLIKMMASNFSPEDIVYLPHSARGVISVTNGGAARVLSSRVTAHRVETELEATAASMVVLAQSFYHPWTAFVDGKSARVWRANHAFQALEVGPGRHQVVLIYRDRRFLIGAVISVVSLIGVGVSWVLSRICASRALIRDRKPSGWEEKDAVPALPVLQ